MSNYSEQVKAVIEQMPFNKIFVASELKSVQLRDIPEEAYYKSLERLAKQEVIVHLTKGLYYRPVRSGEKVIPISSRDIIEHYVAKNAGIIVGDSLSNQEGLTSRPAKNIKILSSNLREERKHVGEIEVEKINIELNDKTISAIRTLEILQAYDKIEELNKNKFLLYFRKFAEEYSDETMQYVIEHRKYKKSTIAFLERMLTWYGVENTLGRYLSPLSQYKIPTIQELRASVPTKVQTCLQFYMVELENLYKNCIDRIILYGSYARGDYSEDSDVDLMILLRISDIEIRKYREQLSNLTYDFNVSYNVDIKPIAKSKEEFLKWVNVYPFYANVQREGVELFGIA